MLEKYSAPARHPQFYEDKWCCFEGEAFILNENLKKPDCLVVQV